MERVDWTLKENQTKAVMMVKDAYEQLGSDPALINALLPEPLMMQLQVHETGCQLTLLLSDKADAHQIIVAWTGSVWYNPGYEFNDRNKIFGIAPDVQFAAGAINDFFDAVGNLIAGNLKAKADADKAVLDSQAESREQALAYYATQFPAMEGVIGAVPGPVALPPIRITEAAPEGNEETSG